MAITHARIAIGITPTLISSSFAGRDGQAVLVQNPSNGTTVYLGGEGVTTTAYGFQLDAGSHFTIEMQNGETLFGVVASSTQTVNVIRQGA